MAKQKRKFTEVREKKNKKFKKASAKEAPEIPLGTKEACPKVHIDQRKFGKQRGKEEESLSGEANFKTLQETDPELSPEERRIQERKLKKERKKEERKRLREAGIKAQTPPTQRSGAELALDYLCGWAQKCENWKFQKTRQTWLLLNMYDSDKVPSEHFSTLLAYLEGLKGQARELTVQKAEAMIQELDKEGTGDPEPLLLEKMQRIRQVLQLLS